MKRLVVLSACVFAAAASLFAPRLISEDLSSVQKAVRGNTEFALDLYKQLGADEGNLFFSPYSISAASAMTHAGAWASRFDDSTTAPMAY
jgi:serine protease inhibitor